jgi:hypothetical protein
MVEGEIILVSQKFYIQSLKKGFGLG